MKKEKVIELKGQRDKPKSFLALEQSDENQQRYKRTP